ncbi:MAG: hypothetical protein RLZZ399_1887 [Verrucomicrobiota bacterium]|jgi:formylglycine-generating enzyme required for sulfatase activity/serine/threonine protein kinase
MSTDFPASQGLSPTGSFDPELLKAGQRLAGVFILKKVLPAAMGESPIWIAQDEVAEREVSLHFIPSEIGTDPDVCEAIRSEVRRGRQLIHPNILRVHDLADEPDFAAVVMDSFEGQSLARLLQENERGFWEASEIRPWVGSILETLADAHGIGLLHRDLNLHDLILTPEGRVMIAQFGISRVVADSLREAGVADQSFLLNTSPQQLDHAFPSVSDDVYSLGTCLFEMLTGRPVFEGTTLEGKIRSERPPEVMEMRQRLGRTGDLLYPRWEKVIVQCLSKNPAERPRSIVELQERLGFRTSALPEIDQEPASEPAATEKAPVRAGAAAKEPQHLGLSDVADEEPMTLDSEARETMNLGPRRPILTSPVTPLERERQGRANLLLWLAVLGGAGVALWFGGRAVVKRFSAKPLPPPPVEAPALVPDKSEGQFVAPAAPGTPAEVTALRPGQPLKPKSGESPDSAVRDSIGPVTFEPPSRPVTAVPRPPADTAPTVNVKKTEAPKPVPTEVPPPPASPVVDTRLDDAQKVVDEARALQDAASKEYARLKSRKDPNAAQRAAIAKAKKAKEQADLTLEDAEKALDHLMKTLGPVPAPVSPVPPAPPVAPSPEAPGTPPIKQSIKSKGASENSVGMWFVPVGDVQFSIFETRVRDYELFVEETGYPAAAWKNPGIEQGPDHPVVKVSWNDALSFCKWLTDRERKLGLLEPSEYYRLPTDREWSKAVGLPEEPGKSPMDRDNMIQGVFSWGTQWPPPAGAGNFTGQESGSDMAIKSYSDPFPWTAPVGSFDPTANGLYDLSGNVWEWCMDTITKQSRSRVLRGGSWYQSIQEALWSACRLSAAPDVEKEYYGFRVVRSKDGGKLK